MTAWISFLSEYLVNAIEGASEAWNISLAFISVIFAPNCYQLFVVLSLIRWVVIEFSLLASFKDGHQDIPFETQFSIVEAHEGDDESAVYTFLPILEGDFRAVLQGNERNELEFCLESGDWTLQ